VGGEGKGGEEEANVVVLPSPDETDSNETLEVSNREISGKYQGNIREISMDDNVEIIYLKV
jgi:hypothetical protein